MFYFPDKIILAILSGDAAARFQGATENCLENINVPCSIDYKKSAAGELDRRVRTDALVVVPRYETNLRIFQVGAQFVVQSKRGLMFEVLDVDEHEGVFGNAGTLEMKCVRKQGQLPISGPASVRTELAARRAALHKPT